MDERRLVAEVDTERLGHGAALDDRFGRLQRPGLVIDLDPPHPPPPVAAAYRQ